MAVILDSIWFLSVPAFEFSFLSASLLLLQDWRQDFEVTKVGRTGSTRWISVGQCAVAVGPGQLPLWQLQRIRRYQRLTPGPYVLTLVGNDGVTSFEEYPRQPAQGRSVGGLVSFSRQQQGNKTCSAWMLIGGKTKKILDVLTKDDGKYQITAGKDHHYMPCSSFRLQFIIATRILTKVWSLAANFDIILLDYEAKRIKPNFNKIISTFLSPLLWTRVIISGVNFCALLSLLPSHIFLYLNELCFVIYPTNWFEFALNMKVSDLHCERFPTILLLNSALVLSMILTFSLSFLGIRSSIGCRERSVQVTPPESNANFNGIDGNLKKAESIRDDADKQIVLRQAALAEVLDGWKDSMLTIGTLGFDLLKQSNSQNEYFVLKGEGEGIRKPDEEEEEDDDEDDVNNEDEVNPLIHTTFPHHVDGGWNSDSEAEKPEVVVMGEMDDCVVALDDPEMKRRGERITLAELFLAESGQDLKMKADCATATATIIEPDSGKKKQQKPGDILKHGFPFTKKLKHHGGEGEDQDSSRPVKKLRHMVKKLLKRKIHPVQESKKCCVSEDGNRQNQSILLLQARPGIT
ncbi:Protein TILLER ANGLE CONTROL 1 [Linum perenne]